MFKVTKYPHGTFSWADALSIDAKASKQFYADLMGWAIEDVPMGNGEFYTMFKCDGEYVAGLGQMPKEMQDQGMPSVWQSYITVDDIDAMAAKVTELGGTVLNPAMDVFDSGRMLVLQDPTGAAVSLWQAKNHIGSGLVNKPGAMTWNELNTRDAVKAGEFFSKLLGWETHKNENMDGYYTVFVNGRANGGIMQMTAEWGDMPPHWMVYFSVADIDASVAKVKELGGEVPYPVMEATEVGRFAVVKDPQGGVCSLIQSKEPQPWDVKS